MAAALPPLPWPVRRDPQCGQQLVLTASATSLLSSNESDVFSMAIILESLRGASLHHHASNRADATHPFVRPPELSARRGRSGDGYFQVPILRPVTAEAGGPLGWPDRAQVVEHPRLVGYQARNECSRRRLLTEGRRKGRRRADSACDRLVPAAGRDRILLDTAEVLNVCSPLISSRRALISLWISLACCP